MQGKNPPAEPGPAGGLRFSAWDGAETLEISARSRDLLYLCVITRSAQQRAPPGAGGAMPRPRGLACPPALASLPPQFLGNTLAADSRRRVVARGETAFPEALSTTVTRLGNIWGGLGEPSWDLRRTKQLGGIRGKRVDGSWVVFPKFFIVAVRLCPPGCPWLCGGFPEVSGITLGRENSITLHPAEQVSCL